MVMYRLVKLRSLQAIFSLDTKVLAATCKSHPYHLISPIPIHSVSSSSLSTSRTRRKSCKACTDPKIKCDLERPCLKCTIRDKECICSTIISSSNTTGASGRGESGFQGLGIDDLNEFVSQTQAQVDSTLSFPSSADIRSNANDLEFFTSSFHSQSQSAYFQPTSKEVITHLPISNPPYPL